MARGKVNAKDGQSDRNDGSQMKVGEGLKDAIVPGESVEVGGTPQVQAEIDEPNFLGEDATGWISRRKRNLRLKEIYEKEKKRLTMVDETYKLFGESILLCEGQIVYQSFQDGVLDLWSMGFRCFERNNMVDCLMTMFCDFYLLLACHLFDDCSETMFVDQGHSVYGGIEKWSQTMKMYLPLTSKDSSTMVRVASITCFADLIHVFFMFFTLEKQDFVIFAVMYVLKDVALTLLVEKSELASRIGSAILGILLLQDVVVVPLFVIFSVLKGRNCGWESIWPTLEQESITVGLLFSPGGEFGLFSSGGEFGFVAFSLANRLGVLPLELNTQLLIGIILCMSQTPFLNKTGRKVDELLDDHFQADDKPPDMINFIATELVIILGFGQIRQVLANFLLALLGSGDSHASRGSYVAFELNSVVVKASHDLIFPIIYGNGSSPSIFLSAGISSLNDVMVMCSRKKLTKVILDATNPGYSWQQNTVHSYVVLSLAFHRKENNHFVGSLLEEQHLTFREKYNGGEKGDCFYVWILLDFVGTDTSHNTLYYNLIYAALSVGQVSVTLFNSFWLLTSSPYAARRLQDVMFCSILQAPMFSFHINSLGRIINQFTKDFGDPYRNIAPVVNNFISPTFQSLSPFILIGIISVLSVSTAREVTCLDSMIQAPVYAQFGEALSGLTICTYNAYDHMAEINGNSMDNNIPFTLVSMSSNCWLTIRLAVMGGLQIWLTATFAIMQNGRVQDQKAFASTMDLLLSYVLNVTSLLIDVLRLASLAENSLNAVDRVNLGVHGCASYRLMCLKECKQMIFLLCLSLMLAWQDLHGLEHPQPCVALVLSMNEILHQFSHRLSVSLLTFVSLDFYRIVGS